MVRIAALFVMLLLRPAPARAQAEPDTTVGLPGVTVTATRAEVAPAAAPARVTVLGPEAIAGTGAQRVADLLEARAGVFVKRYGAGLATVSLRGAGASQTLLLLDGHRLVDPQLGQTDLSLLPTFLLASVEVMHGAASPLYGSGGIGGAVHLRTLAPGAADRIKLAGGLGAYGERTGGVLLSGGDSRLSAVVLAAYEGAEGDFPYGAPPFSSFQTLRREGADRRRRTFYTAAGYRAGRHRLRLAGWYNDAERGLPGLATTPPRGERQWDEHLRLWLDDEARYRWGSLRIGGVLQRGALRYVNPQLELDETGRTALGALEVEARLLGGPHWLLAAGAEGDYGAADHPSLAEQASQVHGAAFLYGTGSYGRVLLYPAVRVDAYGLPDASVRAALSPRVGANLRLLAAPALHLKTHAGRSFRTPTFNDRFWQPGGNPDLRPERGWTYEAGLFLERPAGQAELSLFAARTTDQIVWEPTGAGYYAPRNVSRVHTRGFEVSYRRTWWWRGHRLGGGLLYAWTDARDRTDPEGRSFDQPLRYTPREQAKGFLSAHTGPIVLDLNGRYVGRRYVTSDAAQFLDPYVVLDAQARLVGRLFGLEAQLALTVENLLDARYAVLRHYPMPPRHLRVRLLLEIPLSSENDNQ